MSESKTKKQKIVSSSLSCYFCGIAAPTTVDHFPPRICFVSRLGPEEFEFPSCYQCNGMMRYVEQAVGCYVHLTDQREERLIESETLKHYVGIKNNFPELMPILDVSANEKRRALKFHHKRFRVATTFAEEPIVQFPAQVGRAFDLFSAKMMLALYFKTFQECAKDQQVIWADWRPYTHSKAPELVDLMTRQLPSLTLSSRRNVNIGDQFAYRWGSSRDPIRFGILAQIRESAYFFGMIADDTGDPRLSSWKKVGKFRAESTQLLSNDPKRWVFQTE